MVQTFPQPGKAAPPKKLNPWLIGLGIAGVSLMLACGICGVVGFSFSRFPSVPATAYEPYDIANIRIVDFPPPQPLNLSSVPPGFETCEVVLGDGSGYGTAPGTSGRIWIYRPSPSPSVEEVATASLPCVLVPAAGSTLVDGMTLTEEDADAHIPYLEQGFVVIAFSIDGPRRFDPPDQAAYLAFAPSKAGLVNARNAFEYALTLPEVDPKRILIAGHSSAGSLALLYAAHEPRLAGCVAYAPCSNLRNRFPGFYVRMISNQLKQLPEFLVQSSPQTHASRIACPLFLFHAADDDNVPVEESRQLAGELQTAGKQVEYLEVASGGHGYSVMQEGIPKSIPWMLQQRKR